MNNSDQKQELSLDIEALEERIAPSTVTLPGAGGDGAAGNVDGNPVELEG